MNIEQELYKNIPITQDMQIKIVESSAHSVTLTAPLSANINHHQTAFGGSIYSVAVLSCWVLIHQALKALNLEAEYIVIQNGNIDYLKPISNEFEATATWNDNYTVEDFHTFLSKKKKARISIESKVNSQNQLSAKFSGRFVIEVKS